MARKFLIWMHSPGYPMWDMPASSVERIRQALGSGWEVRDLEEPVHAVGDGAERAPGALLEEVRDAEVYCGFGIPREAFRAARRLRWIHSGAAGVGRSLFPELAESDVTLTNSAGVHAEPMAEHAVAMMLHFARGLDVAAAAQDRGEWAHPRLAGEGSPVRELAGATVLVVGYGGVGSAVGRRAAALGMRVLGIRRHPERVPDEVEEMRGPEGLQGLLPRADVLALTVPGTPETEGWIGPAELDRLPDGAVLINLSRGNIVEEDALAEALASERLRGGGLDVFEREPLPPDSSFWEMENVLLTPHVAGVSPRFWGRETDLVVENVRRYRADRRLRNVVEVERGY